MSLETVRLKHIASVRVSNVDKKSVEGEQAVRLCNYTDVYYSDRITAGPDFMAATATEAQIETFRLRKGQTLITKDSETADDIGVPAFVDTEAPDLVCGYHLAQIDPDETKVDPRFLYWSIASVSSQEQFTLGASGVTRFGLRTDTITSLRVSLPEFNPQRRVADFLDDETARIDALIAAKQRMIVILEESVRSMLDEVLDCGDWRRAPLRRFVQSLTQGTSGVAGSRPAEGSEWGLLKLSAVRGGVFRPRENKVVDDGFPIDASLQPAVGEVLVTRSNTPTHVGDACAVRGDIGQVLLPDLIYRLRLDGRLDPSFASMALRSSEARHALSSAARGTSQSMVKLRGEDILNVVVPVPPLRDQQEVVALHDRRMARIEALKATLTAQIGLLRERRQALITAAVTGEIEV